MQVDKPTKNKLKYAPSHLIYGSKVLSYIASHKDFATIIRRPSDYVDPLTILKCSFVNSVGLSSTMYRIFIRCPLKKTPFFQIITHGEIL